MPSKLWVLIIKTQKKIISTSLKKNTLITVLNTEKVKIGDVFHIPAARVSAIGAGALLAEIQQKANIAYRIYNYNRVDSQTGQQIKLYTELALHAINFELFDPYKRIIIWISMNLTYWFNRLFSKLIAAKLKEVCLAITVLLLRL
jgi:mannose-6-phosphate isomerase class I